MRKIIIVRSYNVIDCADMLAKTTRQAKFPELETDRIIQCVRHVSF